MSTRFNSTVSRRNLLAAAATAPLMARAAHAARGDKAATPGHAVIIGDDQLNGSMCWTEIAAAVGLNAQWRCTVLSAENGDLDSLRGQIDRIPGEATAFAGLWRPHGGWQCCAGRDFLFEALCARVHARVIPAY